MGVLYPRCAGLDVHAGSVTACVRIATGAEVIYEHRTMEATGVYWKPIWHVLEAGFTLVLANAMHIRYVPGRKSDMNDATWLTDLL